MPKTSTPHRAAGHTFQHNFRRKSRRVLPSCIWIGVGLPCFRRSNFECQDWISKDYHRLSKSWHFLVRPKIPVSDEHSYQFADISKPAWIHRCLQLKTQVSPTRNTDKRLKNTMAIWSTQIQWSSQGQQHVTTKTHCLNVNKNPCSYAACSTSDPWRVTADHLFIHILFPARFKESVL